MKRLATLASKLPLVRRWITLAPLAWVAAVVPSIPRVMVNVVPATPVTSSNSLSILIRKFPLVGNAVASVTVQLVKAGVIIAADNVVTA